MSEPDFPQEEYEARLKRLQILMYRDDIDAILFTSEAEMRYFTGFRTLFWQSPTRPWFLVIPGQGKPIAIIPEIGAALMRTTWLDDIRTWSSPAAEDDGVSLLAAVLRHFSKIGMLMGRESNLRMPLGDYHDLREKLRVSSFVDVSATIQSIRMVKSPAEIQIIAEICRIASESFENAAELFYSGQILKDTFRLFKIELLRHGAEEVPYLVGGAGQGGYSDVISPPGDRQLIPGDVLMLDTGSSLKGYFCDFDRNFAIDHASNEAGQAYRTLYRATDAALEIARPGVRCSELFAAMSSVIVGDGGGVGRFGHGLGMQLTEPPSIITFDDTVLEAGMVITLEPGMQISNGKIMVHEENLVICDGSPELLTRRAPPELPVI